MTYNPEIPKAIDDLAVSQGELLENFQELNTRFGTNHVPFDDNTVADRGKHKFVTFVEQATDPDSSADEYGLYAKDDGGDTELYARPESNGTVYQITKDGNLYLGLLPIVAVNWDNTAVIQGSSLGVASISTPSTGRFQINFTAAVTAALADSNYFWQVSGFNGTNNAVIAQPQVNATYSDSVDTSRIIFDFVNPSNTRVAITRACAICWRFQ